MKVIKNEYNNDLRLKIKGSQNNCFGKRDVEICNFKFVTILHCKKMKKKDVKDRNILKYETLSMIGYFKIFGDLFHYNIKEMTDIFVTKDEYSLSSIEKNLKLSKLIM